MRQIFLSLTYLSSLLFVGFSSVAFGQSIGKIDIEAAPIEYLDTTGNNRVSRLMTRLAKKQVELEFEEGRGYLRSLLNELQISESSQVLVFSKTSMQVQSISRRHPRAIFFNDDTYVGWVHGSSLAEISTSDPKLGTAFYTVDMMPWRAKIERQDYDCLACHATSMTQGIPGHTVRSVHPTYDGTIDSSRPSYVTDERSPLLQRWGGWYVTGRHGGTRHMGNAYLRGGQLDTQTNGNLSNLRDRFDTRHYLSPYSDIWALMVLEHQTQMHNEMVKADFQVRIAHHDDVTTKEEEWPQKLRMIAEPVVRRLLFFGEASLEESIRGSILFRDAFARAGPADAQGRSLRDFDMDTRMFKYPLSYLIYSETFDSLQMDLKQEICQQLVKILQGLDLQGSGDHLGETTRRDILEILRATKPSILDLADADDRVKAALPTP